MRLNHAAKSPLDSQLKVIVQFSSDMPVRCIPEITRWYKKTERTYQTSTALISVGLIRRVHLSQMAYSMALHGCKLLEVEP